MYNTFNFNGIESSDYSIFMSATPSRPIAAKRVQYFDIPGRNGHLTYDDGSLLQVPMTVSCTIMNITENNLRQIKAWLIGSGNLIFSDEPDVYWKVRLDLQIDFTIPMRQVHQFILIFDCFPMAYSIDNSLVTLTTSPGEIINLGTATSSPVMTVYGSGTITLTVNGIDILLTNVSGSVTIDSDLMDAYTGTVLQNNNMSGDFPILLVGNNTISWVGTVTSVTILPNFRYI